MSNTETDSKNTKPSKESKKPIPIRSDPSLLSPIGKALRINGKQGGNEIAKKSLVSRFLASEKSMKKRKI